MKSVINAVIRAKEGYTNHAQIFTSEIFCFRRKKSKILGFEFGESVHFRWIPLQGRIGKLDSWTLRGILDAEWRVHGGQQRGSLQDEDDDEDS